MDSQFQAPYFDALADYVRSGVVSFHMPGHQQGRGAPVEFVDLVGAGALASDITQVLGMDDIHRSHSVCLRAQQLAAEAYGSSHTYFLVNGSSCGNHAMLMSCLSEGDVVLVPRNAHSSTLGALQLSGARAVYYQNPFDVEMGVFHVPTVDLVERLLDSHPEARALFFTSPTYYGAAADVHRLVRLAHARGLLVLVDEAWGAHLAFHPGLPDSAVSAGADLVVQSSHKLVSGMSQAAMLHLNGTHVDRARLESVLRLLQTTSPSCLLVASLDTARRQLATQGRQLLSKVLDLARYARQGLQEVGARDYCWRPDVYSWDESRLVFSLTHLGFSGFEVERRLRYEHKLQLEMSDSHNLVALITPGHEGWQIDKLVEAVGRLMAEGPTQPLEPVAFRHRPLPESRLTLKQAFLARWESVPFKEAAGRVVVDTVCPYPPGIPWLVPGEVPSMALIEELEAELAAGVTIQGAYDPKLEMVRVVKD